MDWTLEVKAEVECVRVCEREVNKRGKELENKEID